MGPYGSDRGRDRFVQTHFKNRTEGKSDRLLGRGTVTKSPDIAAYNFGQSVTLTATPGRYYQFLRWSDGNTNATRT